MSITITPDLRRLLDNESAIHLQEIRALYRTFDKQFRLNGASLPILFDFSTDSLGGYTPASSHGEAHFRFSLLFIGYALAHPLSKEDRHDLYKHEYAHYMQENFEIPQEYRFSPGIHGSAWKYCCSLVGAAPCASYKMGMGSEKHDYEKVLRRPITDRTLPIRDTYRREKAYQNEKNRVVKYQIGDTVTHPKFGEGQVRAVEQTAGSVRLTVAFGDEVKKIDQKWLIRQQYTQKTR